MKATKTTAKSFQTKGDHVPEAASEEFEFMVSRMLLNCLESSTRGLLVVCLLVRIVVLVGIHTVSTDCTVYERSRDVKRSVGTEDWFWTIKKP